MRQAPAKIILWYSASLLLSGLALSFLLMSGGARMERAKSPTMVGIALSVSTALLSALAANKEKKGTRAMGVRVAQLVCGLVAGMFAVRVWGDAQRALSGQTERAGTAVTAAAMVLYSVWVFLALRNTAQMPSGKSRRAKA